MDEVQPARTTRAAKSLIAYSWAGELRGLLALGWPLVIAQLAQNALTVTDVIMLGWLGPDFLAAGSLANAMFFTVLVSGVGVTGAVAPLVAQALGAGKLRLVRRTVRQGMWVAICLAAMVIPLVWFVRPIYVAIGQDPELSALAEIYMHAACWMFLPAFMIVVLRSFLSAMGATRVVLVITLAGVAVNAVLDYGLIFGNWGFPRLELAGAGVATTVVNFVMLALMAGYVVTHRRYRRYHIFGRFHVPDWTTFFRIWRIGLPIAMMLFAEVGLFTFSSLMQGWIGRDEVAAHAIALQLSSIAFMVPLGLSQAATIRVGLAVGAGSAERVRKAGWVALGVNLAFMASTTLLFLLFPRQLAGLFLDPGLAANLAPLALATNFLLVTALFQLFDGMQVTMAATLRGLNDTAMPLIIAIIGYWAVGFPLAWLLAFVLGWGGIGIWWGLAGGLAVVALSLVGRFALRERLGLLARARTA